MKFFFLLTFLISWVAHADLENGTILTHTTGEQVVVYNYETMKIVKQQTHTDPNTSAFVLFQANLEMTVEGNTCGADTVVSEMIIDSQKFDQQNRSASTDAYLKLKSIRTIVEKADGCAHYSRPAKITVPLFLKSLTGSPKVSAVQKEVFNIAIPIGYDDKRFALFAVTHEWQKGWSVTQTSVVQR